MNNLLDAPTTAAAETAISAKATRMLLRLVRAGQPISRIELARRLDINRSTVTDIFKPLISDGFCVKNRLRQHRRATSCVVVRRWESFSTATKPFSSASISAFGVRKSG
jgi:DNA-binding MarR family transcriptional regulator